jgi:hypothetical protein
MDSIHDVDLGIADLGIAASIADLGIVDLGKNFLSF